MAKYIFATFLILLTTQARADRFVSCATWAESGPCETWSDGSVCTDMGETDCNAWSNGVRCTGVNIYGNCGFVSSGGYCVGTAGGYCDGWTNFCAE